jgi:integrase
MKGRRRKTRSDKFPLTLHPTGQYCKKIKGRIHYFGTDKKRALQRYLDEAAYLHGRQRATMAGSGGNMSVKELCDLYLRYQHSKVVAGDLTPRHYSDQTRSLGQLVSFLGSGRKIRNISTLDLQSYKRRLQGRYNSAHRLNLHIGTMKAMFHWARKNDILEHIPNVDAVSRGKLIHKERFTFNSQEIRKLLSAANVKMQAMIWLGLNCGFGCMDCARLKWKDLDLDHGRVMLARNKTGVARNLPLWPETVRALRDVPRSGPLVFYTAKGHPWVRTTVKTRRDGNVKYTTVNAISSMFARLLKKVRIDVPTGTGFYTLRRMAATLAAKSGDPFAVQRLLGHVNLEMATRYVQDVSEQTDRVVENSRESFFFGKELTRP